MLGLRVQVSVGFARFDCEVSVGFTRFDCVVR